MAYFIAKALLPIYLGIGLGFGAGRFRLIDNADVSSLTSLLMQFALPLSLFMTIGTTPRNEIFQDGSFMAVIVLTFVISFLIMLLLSQRAFRTPDGISAVHALTSSFPNVAGVGLPVLVSVFGTPAALPAAIGLTAGAVTISPMALALLEIAKANGDVTTGRSRSLAVFWPALGKSLSRPIFLGPAAGLGVSLLGLRPPELMAASVAPLASCTAGVGLFLTGLVLSAQAIRPGFKVLASVLFKNVAQPLIALLLAIAFGLSRSQLAEAVVLAAVPCGFFGLIFGAGFGVRPALSGATLVFSSLLSGVTLTIALYLFL